MNTETAEKVQPDIGVEKDDCREPSFSYAPVDLLKIKRNALCYDASHNRYSVVPGSVAPNLMYATEIGARALIDSWPFIHSRLLEIGCGNRPFSLLINSLVSHYVGIDLPSDSSESQSDIWANGLDLPFKLESFDTVLSTDVFNHVLSPTELLRESNRVLKRGGHFVLMSSSSRDGGGPDCCYARYSASGLRRMVEQNGFNVQVLHCQGRVIPYVFNYAVQTLYNSFGKKGRGKPDRRYFDRFLVLAQRAFLKITPKRQVDLCHAWEREAHSQLSDRFNLGHILIAKKVFNLNEYR